MELGACALAKVVEESSVVIVPTMTPNLVFILIRFAIVTPWSLFCLALPISKGRGVNPIHSPQALELLF